MRLVWTRSLTNSRLGNGMVAISRLQILLRQCDMVPTIGNIKRKVNTSSSRSVGVRKLWQEAVAKPAAERPRGQRGIAELMCASRLMSC